MIGTGGFGGAAHDYLSQHLGYGAPQGGGKAMYSPWLGPRPMTPGIMPQGTGTGRPGSMSMGTYSGNMGADMRAGKGYGVNRPAGKSLAGGGGIR
jgi:hypothetical protein